MRKLTIQVVLSALAFALAGSFGRPLTAGESARDGFSGDEHQLVNARGFQQIGLGYPVANWFPLDIDGDGTWELATTVVGSPTRVGIFDPKSVSWVDGPRQLAVSSDEWGVGFWNGHAYLEYGYLSGQTMRQFDTHTELDTALWTIPWTPTGAFFWGRDSVGSQLVGLRRDGSGSCGQYCSQHHYGWNVFDLQTGTLLSVLAGGLGTVRLLSGWNATGDECLVVYECHSDYTQVPMTGEHGNYYQSCLKVDSEWREATSWQLPGLSTSMELLSSLWGMDLVAVVPLSPGNGMAKVVIHSCSMDGAGVDAGQFLCAQSADGSSAWVKQAPRCFMCAPQPSPYVGLASFDITADGADELILPLNSGVGWEIRSPIDGAVEDTIGGMPKADLRSGPLLSAGKRDLFYLSDSTLYIYTPDTYSSVLQDEPHPTSATALSVTAVPNPFNTAVNLSWLSDVPAVTLDIFNILGQRVRSYDFRSDAAMTSSVVWDGKDEQGQISPSGMYFARLHTRARTATAKLVLLK